MKGTKVAGPLWGGKGVFEEIEAGTTSPRPRQHWHLGRQLSGSIE